MPEDEPEKKRPLANLARVLIGAGLPTLGAAVGGPVGAVVASEVARRVTGNKAADPETTVAALTAAGSGTAELFAKLQEMEMSLRAKQLEAMVSVEEQITQRHAVDMASDSKLAKTVRPGGLWTLVIAFVLFIFLSAFCFGPRESADYQFYAELLKESVLWWGSIYTGLRTGERVVPSVLGKVGGLFKKGGSDA